MLHVHTCQVPMPSMGILSPLCSVNDGSKLTILSAIGVSSLEVADYRKITKGDDGHNVPNNAVTLHFGKGKITSLLHNT